MDGGSKEAESGTAVAGGFMLSKVFLQWIQVVLEKLSDGSEIQSSSFMRHSLDGVHDSMYLDLTVSTYLACQRYPLGLLNLVAVFSQNKRASYIIFVFFFVFSLFSYVSTIN